MIQYYVTIVYQQVKTEFTWRDEVQAAVASEQARRWIIVATITGSILLGIIGVVTAVQVAASSGDNQQ